MEHVDFTWLEGISDPWERTVRTHGELARYQEAAAELQRLRRAGIEELLKSGVSAREIAPHLGLTRQRVEQISRAGPPPARRFFGRGGVVTVAVGEKTEAPKPSGHAGPTVATEDLAAYDILGKLARDCRFEEAFEAIKPPGTFDTNRDGLVVACGPRLSPVLAQMLQGDTAISFGEDEGGWFLQDNRQGLTYRSPSDEGWNGDVAYLGRLPRLDGKGSFVYMAGVHSAGAAGVAHWLSQNLGELFAEVGDELFSTLIGCTYEMGPPWRVRSSERLTPIYLRGAT